MTLDTTPPTTIPQATQVGTASTGFDVDISSSGTLVHWVELNNDPNVPCGISSSGNPGGIDNITYFYCAGTP